MRRKWRLVSLLLLLLLLLHRHRPCSAASTSASRRRREQLGDGHLRGKLDGERRLPSRHIYSHTGQHGLRELP